LGRPVSSFITISQGIALGWENARPLAEKNLRMER